MGRQRASGHHLPSVGAAAQDQGRHYADQLGVPFVFLSNGEEVWFLDRETDAHARKLLVEMATGTGKTRPAAAFVKRLFEAGIVTRVLFLVDRIVLAGQAEDAFNDHLHGRRFPGCCYGTGAGTMEMASRAA